MNRETHINMTSLDIPRIHRSASQLDSFYRPVGLRCILYRSACLVDNLYFLDGFVQVQFVLSPRQLYDLN